MSLQGQISNLLIQERKATRGGIWYFPKLSCLLLPSFGYSIAASSLAWTSWFIHSQFLSLTLIFLLFISSHLFPPFHVQQIFTENILCF